MQRFKSFTVMFVLIAAFGIVGCGGGGGSTATEEPPAPTVPDTSLADAQAAATAAATAAMAAVDGVADISDADVPSHTRAVDAAADAKKYSDMAQAADNTADAERYQAMAEAARDNAVNYAAMVRTAQNSANAAAAAMAAQEAATEVAETKAAAITREAAGAAAQLVRPFDGGEAYAEDSATTMYNVKITYDGGPMIEIMDSANLGKADPKFSVVDGKHMRTIGKDTEIIGAYTDIEAPTATPFGMVHNLTVNDDEDTTREDFQTMASDAVAAMLDKIDLGIAAARDGETRTESFRADNAATTTADEGLHRGRFDGAMGTFDCTATGGCSATVNDEGVTTAVTGTFEFTPDDGATVDVADANYLYYGFWLKKNDKGYSDVQTFHGAVSSVDSPTYDAVEGTATFEGNAAGVYTYDTLKSDGSKEKVTAGSFEADVELTASFGGDDVAVSKQDSIEGMITNFDLSGGESNAWVLKLNQGTITASDGTFSGMTNGGATNAPYEGQLYGGGGEDAPTMATGEFNGNFVNGMVAGAFGATTK